MNYDRWLCPFCGSKADINCDETTVSLAMRCSCGALALAAPTIDRDEIIDDAINIFKIKISDKAKGYDAKILEEMQLAGLRIWQGENQKVTDGPWGEFTSYWFKMD